MTSRPPPQQKKPKCFHIIRLYNITRAAAAVQELLHMHMHRSEMTTDNAHPWQRMPFGLVTRQVLSRWPISAKHAPLDMNNYPYPASS